jgi:hypothetical protein
MKLEFFTVASQIYLIPTIKITHDRLLNGYHEVQLIWLKWGFSFMFNRNDRTNDHPMWI